MITVETLTDPRSGALVVKLSGEAGMATIDDLEIALTRVVAGRPALVLMDLSGLTFMSSIGIGALVTFHRGVVRGGGHVIMGGARFAVQSALGHARLDRFFEMYPTLDEAITEAIATGRAHDCEAGAH